MKSIVTKRLTVSILCVLLIPMLLGACAKAADPNSKTESETQSIVNESQSEPLSEASEASEIPEVFGNIELEDGVYSVDFNTDSGMFHINEALKGKGTLTVSNGSAVLHITLVSKKITNLYIGLAEQAETDEANWLMPTTDSVTYEDGYEEEVYGFDVPVTVIDQEFNLAILGEKGTWYDHKVSFSNPVLVD